ncbi:MAG: rRNA maturation RNase YbeY [Candidatus Omnitrophica bacterium]|nr:rRNA maturation RNase YbeY [Candidatus Omnitrophota bacterium]
MELALENLQKKVALNSLQIRKIVKAILRHEGIDKASLSIVFVSHQRIKALNKKYLGREYATDVLAFDLAERRDGSRRGAAVIGDVIISTDAAIKNAGIYDTSLSEEIALYLIHGILHLSGYDDHKAGDIRRMRKKEQQYMTVLGAKTRNLVKGGRK